MLSAAVDLGAVDATFSQWEADARSGTAEVRKAMMLEIDVAFAAGFGSVSQFYDRFTSSCGTTPRPLRLDMRS